MDTAFLRMAKILHVPQEQANSAAQPPRGPGTQRQCSGEEATHYACETQMKDERRDVLTTTTTSKV